jgi:hypothetical protein
VGGQRGAVHQLGLLLGEQALQTEDQGELAPPLHGGLLVAGVQLDQRGLERPAPRGTGGERRVGVLALEDECFSRERFGAL